MKFRITFLALLLLGLCSFHWALAARIENVDTEPKSGVTIELHRPFEEVGAVGYHPIGLTITNRSGRERTWQLTSEASYGSGIRASWSLSVPAGESRSFKLLLPLGLSRHQSGIRITIYGHGIDGAFSTYVSTSLAYHGGTDWPSMVGMSQEVHRAAAGVFEDEYQRHHPDVVACTLPLKGGSWAYLPDSWKGWTQFSVLLFTQSDWEAMDPAERRALLDWVRSGGEVRILGRPEGSRAGTSLYREKTLDVGLGELHYYDSTLESEVQRLKSNASDFFEPFEQRTIDNSLVKRLSNSASGDLSALPEIWRSMGVIPRGIAWISILLILYVIVIGPVNLFVLAPAHRRQRLFVTVPAISLIATTVLGVAILFADGTGGRGEYIRATLYLPESNRAVVWGDHVSRTGLLLDKTFTLSDETLMGYRTPVGDSLPNQLSYRDGKTLSGEWFRSRFTQMHTLGAVIPSREAVELVAVEAGAPVVQSAIQGTIRELVYVDAQGRYWKTDSLRTGERKKLVPADAGEYLDLWTAFERQAGHSLHGFTKMKHKPGGFLAMGNKDSLGDAQMLGSLQWTGQDFFFGTLAGKEENQ